MAAHRRLGMALLGQAMLGWSAFRFAWCCNAGTAALGPACSWKGRAPQRRHGPVLLGMTQRGRDALATQAARGGARLGLACSMQGPAKHRGRGLATATSSCMATRGNAGAARHVPACLGCARSCHVRHGWAQQRRRGSVRHGTASRGCASARIGTATQAWRGTAASRKAWRVSLRSGNATQAALRGDRPVMVGSRAAAQAAMGDVGSGSARHGNAGAAGNGGHAGTARLRWVRR